MRIKVVQNIIDFLRGKNFKKIKITYKNVKEIIKANNVLKLHVGCGTVYKDGWINIDNNSDENISHLDFMWDLRKPLPFKDNSVDFIYNEHFLEHLTVDEAKIAIQSFMKLLKPNGVMRIAMPDLKDVINNYINPNSLEEDKDVLSKYGMSYIKTRAQRVNVNFYSWGHKWLYDAEELERRLREAGCENIKFCELRKSEHKELGNLETRNESTLIAEVTK